ncbi:MAG: 5'/3'-nucleotidase SurE, partial [Spirochaetaceae bacterium]|nr:5'/3'-nucleotidase SurE [Spirochaetaceae bacterium]
MNVLVTNDDGITSEGLLLLVQALREQGKHTIYVIAPDSNRSAVSHSVSSIMQDPIRLKEVDKDMWSCSGTPADCVMLAFMGVLPVFPDMVLSGINRGPNIGTDIIYSGTVAGARQGALHHVPGIALSLAARKPFFWDGAVRFIVEHIDEFFSYWRADTFININLPNIPEGPAGSLLTFPSRRRYHDTLTVIDRPNGRKYCFIQSGDVETVPAAGSDYDAVSRNLASICLCAVHPAAALQS